MNEGRDRIAIVAGIRTPFGKGGGQVKDIEADDLGAFIVRELLARTPVSSEEIDEVIFGNVLQPANSTNIARILAVKGGSLKRFRLIPSTEIALREWRRLPPPMMKYG